MFESSVVPGHNRLFWPSSARSTPVMESAKQRVKLVVADIEKRWSYFWKLNMLSRYGLNLSLKVRNGPKNVALRVRILKSIAALKVFSFINISFNLISFPDLIRRIGNSLKLEDREGVALGTLSAVALTADTIDSLSTALGGLMPLVSKASIAFFSLISSPLIATMITAGAILKVVHLYHLASFSRKIAKVEQVSSPEEMKASLLALLKKEIGNEKEKSRREVIFKRHTNQDSLNEMKELEQFILQKENFANEVEESKIRLKRLQWVIRKEIRSEKLNLAVTAIRTIAFGLMFVPGTNIVPLVLFATATLINLLIQIHKDRAKSKMPLLSQA